MFFRSAIFGSLDGLNSSFILICGAAGGGLQSHVVIILGFSSIFASAFGMGVCEFFSSKAHKDYISYEKRRALWELKHSKANEVIKVSLYLFSS
jgi:DNA damage-binding protein 1